jgi:hypothetical protein
MTNEFDIIDHPLVNLWLREQAKKEPLFLVTITEGNIVNFNKMWGTQTGLTKRFHFWKREHHGITIFVYSDNHETFYKVQYLGSKENFIEDKKIGSYLTGFLTKLGKEFLQS